jgi:hypothetical protein
MVKMNKQNEHYITFRVHLIWETDSSIKELYFPVSTALGGTEYLTAREST